MYKVDPERCQGCGACSRVCPTDSVKGKVKTVHTIDIPSWTRCGSCVDVCRFDAIKAMPPVSPKASKKSKMEMLQDRIRKLACIRGRNK
ncbi:MAG: indolepyruvate ferredoxin oxidoreductase subunit alpha [bacterium]